MTATPFCSAIDFAVTVSMVSKAPVMWPAESLGSIGAQSPPQLAWFSRAWKAPLLAPRIGPPPVPAWLTQKGTCKVGTSAAPTGLVKLAVTMVVPPGPAMVVMVAGRLVERAAVKALPITTPLGKVSVMT